jgi:hypothetical protein
MAELPRYDHGREVRDTILKSGLTGVAATVLAVTIFSPAGLGGMIGTSLASGFGLDSDTAHADDIYANLPAYPAPLSHEEISDIQSQLARTTASLEITRAATEAKIEHVRSIAMSHGVAGFAQASSVTPLHAELRPTTAEPAPAAPAPTQVAANGGIQLAGYHDDAHLELADLMFAHEDL